MKDFDMKDFERQRIKAFRAKMLPKLLDARKRRDWKEFIHLGLGMYEIMPDAFMFYDEVPDNLKYNFAIDAYLNHGDSMPAVRKAVRGARKYGARNLPKEVAERDPITIYRAGEEDITKCKYRLSWTTSEDVALFFLDEWRGKHARFLYKGQIHPKDIIAYTNDRNEFEVIQYRKVFNIELIQEAGKCQII